MTYEQFERLFESDIIDRLAPIGFKRRTKDSKTIDLFEGIVHVSFMRLSGRLSFPGCAVWTLCFRHTFLRRFDFINRTYSIRPNPTGFFTEHFPFVFAPRELICGERELRYKWHLNFTYDRFNYQDHPRSEVKVGLQAIGDLIEHRFVPWAKALSPVQARKQLIDFGVGPQQFGGSAQVEQDAIKDYDQYLAQDRSRIKDTGAASRSKKLGSVAKSRKPPSKPSTKKSPKGTA